MPFDKVIAKIKGCNVFQSHNVFHRNITAHSNINII